MTSLQSRPLSQDIMNNVLQRWHEHFKSCGIYAEAPDEHNPFHEYTHKLYITSFNAVDGAFSHQLCNELQRLGVRYVCLDAEVVSHALWGLCLGY